jgi:hypothetical protein
MSPSRSRSARRAVFQIAASCLLVSAFSSQAQAGGFFEALFSGLGFRPPPVTNAPPVWYMPDAPPSMRRRAIRPIPKIDLANLPANPAVKAAPKPPAPISDAEAVASIMGDPTLRRGDIVIFPSGPKVFRGEARSWHKSAEFEDVGSSRYVGDDTRKKVLALTRTTPSEFTRQAQGPALRRANVRRPAPPIATDDVASTGSVTKLSPAQ